MTCTTIVKTCEVEGCEKPRFKRYCHMHRSRLKRRGTLDGGPANHGTIAERYERFVVRNPDGCWGWKGAIGSSGYPELGGGRAHRVSYERFVGAIPNGLSVCHRCDNPPCTNPEHLFVGTSRDNMLDASQKGRLRGKLTATEVRQIRALCDAGATRAELARRFGVCRETIRRIAVRETWHHA